MGQEYILPIRNFIDGIRENENLIAKTNGMSTQIFEPYDEVMDTLKNEIKTSFENPHSVYVRKVINADLTQPLKNDS